MIGMQKGAGAYSVWESVGRSENSQNAFRNACAEAEGVEKVGTGAPLHKVACMKFLRAGILYRRDPGNSADGSGTGLYVYQGGISAGILSADYGTAAGRASGVVLWGTGKFLRGGDLPAGPERCIHGKPPDVCGNGPPADGLPAGRKI